jgi:hypothetical protein
MPAQKQNDKLAKIRDQLVDAVLTGLADDKQRNKASFLGVAVQVLRLHGGPDEIRTPEEDADDRLARLRASLTDKDGNPLQLPFLDPPSAMADHDDDSDDESATDF